MEDRAILEVETPVLGQFTDSDPHIRNLATIFHHPGCAQLMRLYLQASPECAMKRLLAAGSGPIYQIARVFRDNESGRLHNPEFTLLEWYRPGFDHHALMEEVNELLQYLGFRPVRRTGYAEVFSHNTGLDPHRVPPAALKDFAVQAGLEAGDGDASLWLDFIFSVNIVPHLGHDQPVFVHDYPASLGSLARLSDGNPPVAERFELFISGMEIANGFHELCDAGELRQRLRNAAGGDAAAGGALRLADRHLLNAVAHRLPPCAGVAVGIDRLLMARHGRTDIREVIAFPIDEA